jgi:hypothetical protein
MVHFSYYRRHETSITAVKEVYCYAEITRVRPGAYYRGYVYFFFLSSDDKEVITRRDERRTVTCFRTGTH